ncbi:MAG: efflux RND transporter periplasmic adaptor subunit [Proteobacteria bacterium]|nr:MAG: efflux RND transporter periplasmic adaptor subunit [Pseudomonadota bacterium]
MHRPTGRADRKVGTGASHEEIMRWMNLVGVGVIGLVGFGGILAYHFARESSAQTDASRAPSAQIPVTAASAEVRDVPVYVEGLGTVQAFNTVSVRTRVDGQITQVLFKEGQDVKAGDPLFQIDPRPFQATLAQAQAAKQKDQALLQSAQLDLDRYAQLLPSGSQTRQSYDQQKGTVGQLQASVQADEAQIESARLNLDYSLIRAPIDGRTGQRMVDVGNVVQAAQSASLVVITQIKPIFVSFTVPANRLDDIRASQSRAPLKAIADAMDDQRMLAEGELTLVDNQVDVATGTIHLKAQYSNDEEPLWPGQFVNVRLVLSVRHDAVTVPAETVMQGPNGSYVYLVAADDTAHRRDVTVAATQDGLSVISDGLAARDRVVVEGQYRLTDGAKTRIEEPRRAQAAPQPPR